MYADGPSSATIAVDVTDEDGTYQGVATKAVTVTNAAPTLTVAGPQTVMASQSFTITDLGMFTDPGFDNPNLNPATHETFTYQIDWGDGSPLDTGTATIDTMGSPGQSTEGSFDGTHTYSQTGYYTVTITLSDDDGGEDTRYLNLEVTPAEPPAAPTDLTAAPASDTEIDLTWTDNANSETGFKIERSPDESTWTLLATLGRNVTTYSDTGLTEGTPYYYRVWATNTIGDPTTAPPPPLRS